MEPSTESHTVTVPTSEILASKENELDATGASNSVAVAANSAQDVNGVPADDEKPSATQTTTVLSRAKTPDPVVEATTTSLHHMSPISSEPSIPSAAVELPTSNVRDESKELVSIGATPRLIDNSHTEEPSTTAVGLPEKEAPADEPLPSVTAHPSSDPMDVDPPVQTTGLPVTNGHSNTSESKGDSSLPESVQAMVDEGMPDAPIESATHSTTDKTAAVASSVSAASTEPKAQADTESIGMSVSQSKTSRPRDEEGDSSEPASKRVKGESDTQAAPQFKIPDPPGQVVAEPTTAVTDASSQSQPLEAASAAPSMPVATAMDANGKTLLPLPPERGEIPKFDLPMTKAQQKHLQRGLTNMKKSQHAPAFTAPVDWVSLNIPSYPDIVKNPMDLRTIDHRLKDDHYKTVREYLDDFDQMVTNTVLFNGETHGVTQHAFHLRSALDRHLLSLPDQEYTEPTAAEKKAKKAAAPKPPPRRESRSSLGNAKSPTAPSPQTTFALGPSGVPLIRRDSTVADGRPKREIHPPAPKDLPYSASKPKRKKFQLELRFCIEVLSEMKKPKYHSLSNPFLQPVDPVSLNIPNYHKIIKKPMDISTIDTNLGQGQYENSKEFEADIRLMFQNCYKFNGADHPVYRMGKDYEKIFDEKWAQKSKWLNDHAPSSEAQSPGSFTEADDEEEEDEQEEEEEEDDDHAQIDELQKSIAAFQQQLNNLKKGKKKSPPVSSKKTKGAKAAKKEPKKAQPAKTNKKGSGKKGGSQKARIMSYEEKRAISDRINELPENKIPQVLTIIRENMPALKGAQEEEIELDIDELSDDVLYKLLNYVKKQAPRPEDKAGSGGRNSAPAPARPKKNKPMNKAEQEAQIEEIRGKLNGLHDQGAGNVDSPEDSSQAVANEDETSGDEDSEESEED